MNRTLTVLFVDDDEFLIRPYMDAFESDGFRTIYAPSATKALRCLERSSPDIVVVDVMMSPGRDLGYRDTAGGQETGIALARRIRRSHPDAFIFAFTSTFKVHDWFPGDAHFTLVRKSSAPLPADLLHRVRLKLGLTKPLIFIVHGRANEALRQLKRLIVRDFGLPEPLVLASLAGRTLTVLEKFEKYAARADIAIVLMTGDDKGRLQSDRGRATPRARINVQFELGYFCGLLDRKTGRIIVLSTANVDKGSDLQGLTWVDVSDGIAAARDDIQREIFADRPQGA
jgi:predicted nucleotide-binding protein